ncbi:hypothetical protein M405DRAFT_836559 [Rhizopogon salebrosus TDB-379]|nr:hypothetical protein M405DRAFT_836559 [Rhizopogon salebrosus TDB-379]
MTKVKIGLTRADQMVLRVTVRAPEWAMMAGLVFMNQIVVAKEILVDGPAAQVQPVQAVLQIQMSQHYHILIFMRVLVPGFHELPVFVFLVLPLITYKGEKLPKVIVERIPLVIYIPPPPEDDRKAQVVHSYPPKPPAMRIPSRQFVLFCRRPINKAPSQKSEIHNRDWEQCKYPFVRLEGCRAACSICLMDFEEPKRLGGAEAVTAEKTEESTVAPEANAPREREEEVETPVERITEEHRSGPPRPKDARVGPQPLRLLPRRHKTCIDPWLTDMSGRCPECQRPVEQDVLDLN